MNLNEMIEAEIENGYGDTNAQAKVCQDIKLQLRIDEYNRAKGGWF